MTSLISVVIAAMSIASGVDRADAARISLLVFGYCVAGALLWLAFLGRRYTRVSETVGMGAVFGLALAGVAGQLLHQDLYQTLILRSLPLVVVVLVMAFPRIRRRALATRFHPFRVDEFVLWGSAFLIAWFSLGSFFSANMLFGGDVVSYYIDIPFHQALADSLMRFGPGNNILLQGTPLRYHWFSNAWVGSMDTASGAAPFIALTRTLPILITVTLAALIWAWVTRLASGAIVPVVAAVAVLICPYLLSTGSGLVIFPESPSQMVAAVFVVAALVLLTILLREGGWYTGAFVSMLIAVGTLAKAPAGVIIVFGAAGSALIMRMKRRKRRVLVTTALIAAFASAGVVLAFEISLGGSNGLSIGFGDTFQSFGIPFDSASPLSQFKAVLVLLGFVASAWFGVAVLLVTPRHRWRPEVWIAISAAVCAPLIACLTTQAGGSQIYFVYTATVIVIPVSVWGVSVGMMYWQHARLRFIIPVLIVASAGIGMVYSHEVLRNAPPSTRVLMVYAGAVGVGMFMALPRLVRDLQSGALQAIAVMAALLIAVTSGIGVRTLHEWNGGLQRPGTHIGGDLSRQDHELFAWIRNQTPSDAIFAISRQCVSRKAWPEQNSCDPRWFMFSAMTGRAALTIGYPYNTFLPVDPSEIKADAGLSVNFADDPSSKLRDALLRRGARWVYVDHSMTTTRNWEPYAFLEFGNASGSVLRLRQGSDE